VAFSNKSLIAWLARAMIFYDKGEKEGRKYDDSMKRLWKKKRQWIYLVDERLGILFEQILDDVRLSVGNRGHESGTFLLGSTAKTMTKMGMMITVQTSLPVRSCPSLQDQPWLPQLET
jgi:hypothetical protein